MSIKTKINGVIQTILAIGLGGPQVKNNAGVFEMRNPTDTGFVVTRGSDPVAANDYATKEYVDGGGASGAVQLIRFTIGTGAAQTSVTQLPANAFVIETTVEIDTPYSAGTTISVGQTGGSATLFQATGDNLATSADTYVSPNQDIQAAASPATVSVTIAGGPSVGAGVVLIKFVKTPLP